MAIDIIQNMLNIPNTAKNGKYDVEYIDYSKIQESEKNFYNTDEFNELKLSIEISGLRQNIEVEEIANKFKVNDFAFIKREGSMSDVGHKKWIKNYLFNLIPTDFIALQKTKWFVGMRKVCGVVGTGTGKYKIISGHRRFKACKELYESGNEDFKLIPCRIVKTSSVETEIQLISGNAFNRVLTDYEIMVQVTRLSELLDIQKEKGDPVVGGKRNAIMKLLNLTKTKVGDLQKIGKDLSDGLKEEFKKENIDFTTARVLASQDENFQNAKLEEIKQGSKVTKASIDQEIKEIKKQEEPVQKTDDDKPFEEQISLVDEVIDNTEIDISGALEEQSEDVAKETTEVLHTEENMEQKNQNVPIMGTDTSRIYISDKDEVAAIESTLRKYSGKLSIVSSNIDKYKEIGREPNKNDLDEQMELQIIIKALELLKGEC